jgi:hypothetical protein
MKTFVIALFSAAVAGIIVAFLMNEQFSKKSTIDSFQKVSITESSVKNRLKSIEQKMIDQLSAFASAVEADKSFALKLLAENDKAAPEVAEIAVRFIGPMGFTTLEVIDSSMTIISSGHFPASAGSNVRELISKLTSKPSVIESSLIGKNKLILQAKKEFTIADFPFIVTGGIEINEKLLEELSPGDGVKVICQNGTTFLGIKGIKSISELKDNKLFINEKEYVASMIPLTCVNNNSCSLIILADK